MMKLYSMDDCPWCDILKMRLKHAEIEYEEIKDMEIIQAKGFKTVPRLQFPDGLLMDFEQAIAWVNKLPQIINN